MNDFDLPEIFVLVSFDVVNMFPSIDKKSVVAVVKKVLFDCESSYSMYIRGFKTMLGVQ